MKYLLAPGNSPYNANWINKIAQKLTLNCNVPPNDVLSLKYKHWETGEKIIDFEQELDVLKLLNLSDVDTVFAKSAGVILSILATIQGIIVPPLQFVFVGFPYYFAKRQNFDPLNLLNLFATKIKNKSKIIFLQKPKDPAFYYQDLKNLLTNTRLKYELIKYTCPNEPINNHHYANIDYLVNIICKIE